MIRLLIWLVRVNLKHNEDNSISYIDSSNFFLFLSNLMTDSSIWTQRFSIMSWMKDLNHPLHPLLPTRLDDIFPYTLRHKSGQLYFHKNVTTCRTKRTEDLFTFNYFYQMWCMFWCGAHNWYLIYTEMYIVDFINFSLHYNSLIQ